MPPVDHELIIVGAGPAGLTAGLYAARSRINTLLIERLSPGGQVLNTDWVDNYPGFPEGVSGFELIDLMRAQVERFDLPIVSAQVIQILPQEDHFSVLLPEKNITAKAIIIATGSAPRKLEVAGEKELGGKGVSYCGTCDGPFFRDQTVVAVGGGDTACQEAQYLTRFAKKVYLIHRRNELRAQKILQEKILNNDKIQVVWDSVVERIQGEKGVEGVVLKNVKTGETKDLSAEGVFIFTGLTPTTEFCCDLVDLDGKGFIITDPEMATSRAGVFAAGDCRSKLLRQISTAVGDGATAAFAAEHYLESEDHG